MRVIAATILTFVAASFPSAQTTGALTGARQLERAYNVIFDAQFDRVPAVLAQTCPPAPEEVCSLLDVVSVWWQIQIDPENRSRDNLFSARADAAIGHGVRMTATTCDGRYLRW